MMSRLEMGNKEVIEYLEQAIGDFATEFQTITGNDEALFLKAMNLSAEEWDYGTTLMYRIDKRIDSVYDGQAYYKVWVRQMCTGWEDTNDAEWRWATDLVVDIPERKGTIEEALAYEGLKVSPESKVDPKTEIPNIREWIYGGNKPDYPTVEFVHLHGVEDLEA